MAGIGIGFVFPDNALILYSFSLTKGCSNDNAEYEDDIRWLELTLQILIANLTIYGGSELIVKQLCGEYTVRKVKLTQPITKLFVQFEKV